MSLTLEERRNSRAAAVNSMTPLVESYLRSRPREMMVLLNDRRSRRDPSLAPVLEFLDKPGVYVLYQGENVYYIGRASNLGKRLRAHTRVGSRYSEHWTHISIFAIPDESHVNAVESILIAAVPARNSAKPRIKKIPLPGGLSGNGRNKRPQHRPTHRLSTMAGV
jgi:hypothetical protein